MLIQKVFVTNGEFLLGKMFITGQGDWNHSSQPCVITIKTDSKPWKDNFQFVIQKNIYTNILLLQYDPNIQYKNAILTGNINTEIKKQKLIYVYYTQDKNKVVQIAETSAKTVHSYIKDNLASLYPNR